MTHLKGNYTDDYNDFWVLMVVIGLIVLILGIILATICSVGMLFRLFCESLRG